MSLLQGRLIGGFDPATVPEAKLRHFRGSIATIKMKLPYGPLPNKPNNVFFSAMWGRYDVFDRERILNEFKKRGYTHFPYGPLVDGTYHGTYPARDLTSNPDVFADELEQLWNSGVYPVVFLIPDSAGSPRFVADDNGPNWDAIKSELEPFYRTPRMQRLCRIVCLAWEPDKWKNHHFVEAAKWARAVFPNAYIYFHTPPDRGAPGLGEELEEAGGPIKSEAQMHANLAPYIDGWLFQSGAHFLADDELNDDGRYPVEQFTYDCMDYARRYKQGYGGFPTKGYRGWLDVVAFEYASYWCFWQDMSEAEAVEWGAIAAEEDGLSGYCDGGPK